MAPSLFGSLKRKVHKVSGNNTNGSPKNSKADHGASEVAFAATKEALRILKDTVEGVPAPGLQGAIGGLLAILDVIDRVKQNAEDFEELNGYLKELNTFLEQFVGGEFPAGLRKPSERLATVVSEVENDVQKIAVQRKWRRVVNNSRDAQAYVSNINRIGQALQLFQTQATVAIVRIAEENAKTAEKIAHQYIIDKLPAADGALYNSWERSALSGCFEGTRASVREEIRQWIYDPEAPCVFWLNGLAGTGKSTIAQSIAEFCATSQPPCLGASFFFARDKLIRHSASRLFTTIVRQLASFNAQLSNFSDSGTSKSRLSKYLMDTLISDPSLPHANLDRQFQLLLMQPLLDLLRDAPEQVQFPVIVVVDALDECTENDEVTSILRLILTGCSKSQPPLLKFFITSRPEAHIVSTFNRYKDLLSTQPFILHEVSRDIVQDDIRTYLEGGFEAIRVRWRDTLGEQLRNWPSTQDIQELVEHSAGLFIYASTILKFVDQDDENPQERLSMIWRIRPETSAEVYSNLDQLYRRILESCRKFERTQIILGTLLFMVDPLSVAELEQLLDWGPGEVRLILRRLQSILLIPPNDDHPVRLFHPSFHDFLTTPTRSAKYYVDFHTHNHSIARQCISLVLSMTWDDIDRHLGTPRRRMLKYACLYWTQHLSRSPFDEKLLLMVARWTCRPFVLWMKAINALGNPLVAVSAFSDICGWLPSRAFKREGIIERLCQRLLDLGYSFRREDERRFLLEGFYAIRGVLYATAAREAYSLFNRIYSRPSLSVYLASLGYDFGRFPGNFVNDSPADGIKDVTLHGMGVVLRGCLTVETASLIVDVTQGPDDSDTVQIIADEFGAHDLDKSVATLERASSELHGHPNYGICLNSLALSLMIRFAILGNNDDLGQAIQTFALASRCDGIGSSRRAIFLKNFAWASKKRFDQTNDVQDLRSAIKALEEAADCSGKTSSPSVRFMITSMLARLASLLSDGEKSLTELLGMYSSAMKCAYLVPWAEFRIESRRKALSEALMFSQEAIGAAINAGDLTQAVLWADQAASMDWIDGLHLNDDLHDMPIDIAELRENMTKLGRKVEEPDSYEPFPTLADETPQNDSHCEALNSDWEQLVTELKACPQIPFFRPALSLAELQKFSSDHGYIAMLNCSRTGATALILRPHDDIVRVDLPVSGAFLEELAGYISMPSLQTFRPGGSAGVLQDIWTCIAEPVINGIGLKPSTNPPRLWWCPLGPFKKIPLHAAFFADQDKKITVSDFVVQSYIPTLQALHRPTASPTMQSSFFVIGQRSGSSSSELNLLGSAATRERSFIDEVQQRFGGLGTSSLGSVTSFNQQNLSPPSLTVRTCDELSISQFESDLRISSGLHLDVPLMEDPEDPLESGFLLGKDDRVTVHFLGTMKDGPRFAFLGCVDHRYKQFPSRLPYDLLSVGFHSVVNVQGQVLDSEAQLIETRFYKLYRQLGAARALHSALISLHKEGLISQDTSTQYCHVGI